MTDNKKPPLLIDLDKTYRDTVYKSNPEAIVAYCSALINKLTRSLSDKGGLLTPKQKEDMFELIESAKVDLEIAETTIRARDVM